MSKKRIGGRVIVRSSSVLQRAVEDGAAYGWARAHKHDDAPGKDAILEAIADAVMMEIHAWFLFEELEG